MKFGGIDDTSYPVAVSRVDHLEGVVREHIVNTLIPRIQEHNRVSIDTDRVSFIYYQRLSFGRICSCWSKVDAGPDKQCPVCFGTGFVCGFKKYKCEWEVLDVTAPEVTLVNVIPNYELQRRPVCWTLLPSSVRGYIEWNIQVKPNVGTLDLLKLSAVAPTGTTVTPLVKLNTESSFVDMSKDSVESRLLDANSLPTRLVVRLILTRASPDARLPMVNYLHFRYRQDSDISIYADVPRDTESITLAEMGLYDSWQPITMVLDKTLSNVSTQDFFVRVRDSRRYKVTEVTKYLMEGMLTGTDAMARLVQGFENYSTVP